MKKLGAFLLLSLNETIIGIGLILIIHYYTDFGGWVSGTIILALLAVLAFEFYVYYPHFRKPRIGREEMIGLSGKVIKRLNPEGQVKIKGEIWKARTTENVINKEEEVEVVDMDGLKLLVRRILKTGKS